MEIYEINHIKSSVLIDIINQKKIKTDKLNEKDLAEAFFYVDKDLLLQTLKKQKDTINNLINKKYSFEVLNSMQRKISLNKREILKCISENKKIEHIEKANKVYTDLLLQTLKKQKDTINKKYSFEVLNPLNKNDKVNAFDKLKTSEVVSALQEVFFLDIIKTEAKEKLFSKIDENNVLIL